MGTSRSGAVRVQTPQNGLALQAAQNAARKDRDGAKVSGNVYQTRQQRKTVVSCKYPL